MAESRYEEYFGSERRVGKIPENREEFMQMTMERIRFTISDPIIRRVRMFLVQEQFRNERLAEITTGHQLDGVQHMYARILKAMMDNGTVKQDDPEILALELTSPATVLISKSDRQPGCSEDILYTIEKHVRHFCEVYMKDAIPHGTISDTL